MAEPMGMKYRATEAIFDPDTGARAYNPGDLVHESAVEDGGGRLHLRVGVNVEVREGVAVSRPKRSAPQAQWVDFAVSEGASREAAEGMSRKELIARYGEPDTGAAESGAAAPAADTAELDGGDDTGETGPPAGVGG